MAGCFRSSFVHPLSLRSSQHFPVGLRAQSTPHSIAPSGRIRWYATHSDLGTQGSSRPSRKQITVLSDDGTYKWAELSGREKVARATQQSFNFLLVALGVVMTVRDHCNAQTLCALLIALGRCLHIPLPRRFLPEQQDTTVRHSCRAHQE